MPTFEFAGLALEVDEDGFMQDPNQWNQDVAAALATT